MSRNGDYSTASGATRYKDYARDPVRSITDALVMNINSGNLQLAANDYGRLLELLRERGVLGKDIRYVRKQLNGLAGDARHNHQQEISTIAKSYASRLPNPAPDVRSIRSAKINDGALELKLR